MFDGRVCEGKVFVNVNVKVNVNEKGNMNRNVPLYVHRHEKPGTPLFWKHFQKVRTLFHFSWFHS